MKTLDGFEVPKKWAGLYGPISKNTPIAECIEDLSRAEERIKVLEEASRALLDALEYCHICKGQLSLDEGPSHCEDCAYDCENHEGEECTPIYEFHRRLKALLPKEPV